MHFSDGSDDEMKWALLLTKRPPVQPFSVHAWECCQSDCNLPAAKEVGTKHTQTSRVPDRWVQHILHTALNDYLYKPQVQQEIRNSDRLLEICHQFLKLWLVMETRQTFWPVTRHIFTFRYCYCKELFDIRHQKHHVCPRTTQNILYDVLCCQRHYCTLYLGRPSKMKIGKSHRYIHMNTILLIPTVHSLPQDNIYGPCKMVLQPSTDCFFCRSFIILMMSPGFPVCLI